MNTSNSTRIFNAESILDGIWSDGAAGFLFISPDNPGDESDLFIGNQQLTIKTKNKFQVYVKGNLLYIKMILNPLTENEKTIDYKVREIDSEKNVLILENENGVVSTYSKT